MHPNRSKGILFLAICGLIPARSKAATKLFRIMRLTTLLLLIGFLTASATGSSQTVSLSAENMPLDKVLAAIKEQTGFNFLYGASQIKASKKVTIHVSNAKLDDVLKLCFANQPLTYTIVDNIIVIRHLEEKKDADKNTAPVETVPLTITVKGRIVNEIGEGVVASIQVKGTQNGVSSNEQGFFEIRNVDENAVLVISSVNIEKSVEVKVGGRTELGSIVTRMKVTESEAIEIRSTGYWTSSKKKNLGNIEKITAKEISQQPVNNVLQAAVSRMAGVEVVPMSGVPGANNSIRIRGTSSLQLVNGTTNANLPLYVIDGVRFSSSAVESQGINTLNGTDPLSTINPESIESIEVLKDADATAIYGSLGANGVILITTKRGKNLKGGTSTEASFSRGVGMVPRVKGLMNSQQYLQMRRQGFANDNLIPSSNPASGDRYAPDLTVWDTSRYTDWQEVLVGGTADMTDAQVAFSGGNAQTGFRFGLGYHHETTVFPGDFNYSRLNGSLSVFHNSSNNKFKADFSANYGFDENKLYGGTSEFARTALNLVPVAPALYNPDGSLNWEPNAFGSSTFRNPLAVTLISNNAKNYTWISSGTISYRLFSPLTLRLRAGFSRSANKEVATTPLTSLDPTTLNKRNSTEIYTRDFNSWTAEPQIDYSASFGKGKVEALVGSSFQSSNQGATGFIGYGYASDALLGDLAGADTILRVNFNQSQYKYAAVYGRIGYTYNDRYLINLTGRRDGSSRFGPGNKFGNFGAAAIGWIFSKEKFIEEHLSFLSFGKIRVSYGIAGSDNIGDYQYLDTYTPTANSYLSISGLFPFGLSNADYAWETNKKLEAGLELGFLQDKHSLSVSWYRNRSSNQLVGYSLPRITGFTTVTANLDATIQNSGVEILMQTTNLQKKNFTWRSSFNLSIPKNRLLSYPGLETSSYRDYYEIGYPVSIRKVYASPGVNPQTGIYDIGDADNNGIISTEDQQTIVDFGRRWFGGLNNSFSLQQFEVSIQLEFVNQLGRDPIYNFENMPGGFTAYRAFGNNLVDVLQNSWTKPGDAAAYQRISAGAIPAINGYSKARFSDHTIINASFARVKNVFVSYQLPAGITSRLKLQSVRVYAQGQNLYTITSRKGFDPALTNFAALPSLRVMSVGIQIKL